jgi:hypothetical protein
VLGQRKDFSVLEGGPSAGAKALTRGVPLEIVAIPACCEHRCDVSVSTTDGEIFEEVLQSDEQSQLYRWAKPILGFGPVTYGQRSVRHLNISTTKTTAFFGTK